MTRPQPTQMIPSDPRSGAGPCGLYLHWPFCETKCGYCDFYSVPLRGLAAKPLLDAMFAELHRRTIKACHPIHTIFVGGGTPTTLDAAELDRFVAGIADCCRAHPPTDFPVREFTVEANPATLDAAKLLAMRRSGVNRISMGAQSFHANELAVLERIHQPEDIPAAVCVLREGGLTEYNLDLIFGVPGQTLASWRESMRRAVDLEPQHLSCYGLTYEPGTALTKQLLEGRFTACDEVLEAEMVACTVETLANAGFAQYEISNYARPGHECRHNLIYWHNEPYIGIGPSAAGYMDNRRYKNVANHDRYVKQIASDGHAEAESECLGIRAAAVETIMMQLRLNAGIDYATFATRFGIDLAEELRRPLASLVEQDLVETAPVLRLTHKGALFSDAVITELAVALDAPGSRSLPVIQSGISAPKAR